jgi:hypothetical protein
MRLLGIVFLVGGLLIITFGATWLNVVSPRLEKLPADYRHEEVFEGTYQVLDPAAGQLDEMVVTVRRIRESVRTEGDWALITERVTTTLPTDEPTPQFPPAETDLEVDRVTRLYFASPFYGAWLHGQRYGGMTFPPDIRKDVEYPLWVDEVKEVLPATYSGSTERDGLVLYRFTIEAQDLGLSPDAESGLPRLCDVHIEYLVEPRSGLVVDMDSQSSISIQDAKGGEAAVFTSALGITDEGVSDNLSRARVERAKLVLMGSYMPWLAMGLGMLFGLYGIVLLGVHYWRTRWAIRTQ